MDDLDLSVIYEGEMDREILALCDAINCIPGVRTVDSCYGHGRHEVYVHLKCASIGSLNILCEATSGTVSTHIVSNWRFQINNNGVNEDTNYINLWLVGRTGLNQTDCDLLAKQIREYLKPNF